MPWRWILSLVWLLGWGAGAVGFWMASSTTNTEAEHLAKPMTSLDIGAEVHVEGKIAPSEKVQSLYSKKSGVASLVNVYYKSSYYAAHDPEKVEIDSRLVSTRRNGPTSLAILVGDARLALPLDLWTAKDGWDAARLDLENLPPELQPTPEELSSAKQKAKGTFVSFSVEESIITEGMPVFVAARIESKDPDGALRLRADAGLGRVLLAPGTQEEFIEGLQGSSSGLRIAGWIFLGVGLLPSLIFGLLLLRRKKA